MITKVSDFHIDPRYDIEVKGYGHTDIYTPLAMFVPNMNTPIKKLLEVGFTMLFIWLGPYNFRIGAVHGGACDRM